MDKCPFCSAEEKSWKEGEFDPFDYPARWVCGSTDDLRSDECYEAELIVLREWREQAKKILEVVSQDNNIRYKSNDNSWGRCHHCGGGVGYCAYEEHYKNCTTLKAAALLSTPDSGEWVVVRRDWLGETQLIAEETLYEWSSDKDRQSALAEIVERIKAALNRGRVG